MTAKGFIVFMAGDEDRNSYNHLDSGPRELGIMLLRWLRGESRQRDRLRTAVTRQQAVSNEDGPPAPEEVPGTADSHDVGHSARRPTEPAGHAQAAFTPSSAAAQFDEWTFGAILTVLRELPPETRYGKATLALKAARLLPGASRYFCGGLPVLLGLLGVLDTAEHPGLATRFTACRERDQRPGTRVEVQAPLAWWDSSIGVNEAALAELFPSLGCSSVDLAARPEPGPPLAATVTGALAKLRVAKPVRG